MQHFKRENFKAFYLTNIKLETVKSFILILNFLCILHNDSKAYTKQFFLS